ncbi:UNVERIFIED_ORG: FHA domain-containing protein [Bacillus sp. AZ43]
MPAGGLGGLAAALAGHGLQGGDVDLHGSSSIAGPSRWRATLGRRRAGPTALSTGGPLSTDRPDPPRATGRTGQDPHVLPPPSADEYGTTATRCWTLSGELGAVDVEVTATVGHRIGDVLPAVARALGRSVDALWSGSTRLLDDTPLTDPAFDHGALLGVDRPVRRARGDRPSSALALHVVGGPDAGRALPVGQGRHVIGRGTGVTVRLRDPDVSRRHATVDVGHGTVTVAELGSSNGTRLDDTELSAEPRDWAVGAVLRLGGTALALAGPSSPAAVLEAGTDGRRRLRPVPRFTAPPVEVEVRFPRPPSPPPPRRLAWVAVALPAVGGVAMAWLLRTPSFLFFALLSPVVALGTWLSERWSGRRTGRRELAAHRQAVREAEGRLAAAVRADVRAAEGAHPDLATLTTAARRRSTELWARSPADVLGLQVRVGSGPGPTRVLRLDGDGARSRETAPHVPAVVDLRTTGGLAVVGPRERATGCLAAVLAQLCTLHAPGSVDLLLVVTPERLADWSWARWLPHLPASAVLIATGAPGGDEHLHARLADVVAARRARGAGPSSGQLVVVVDCPLDARTATALRAARHLGVLAVTTAETAAAVTAPVDALLHLTGETGDTGRLEQEGVADRAGITIDRLSSTLATELARDLAALRPASAGDRLPRRVRLLDIAAEHGDRAGSWTRARDRLITSLGRTVDGPLHVDLCRDGPHALVAGTTGSGKSELLQTLIASLALHHPPDRCSFLLVDYKGGAAFAEAAALPHTVGVVTDLDAQTTARALRSLGAELTRREGVLAAHRVADVAALPEGVELARLVIVVDEFAGLSEELPGFVPGLVSIAQRGRSLGVHLVLATQRPSGVVSPEIRANCNLRICLRTTDESESRDVLGAGSAAHLPVDVPGRALLRSGGGAPIELQTARVTGPAPTPATREPQVRPWSWPVRETTPDGAPPGVAESDLTAICRMLDARARSTGTPLPHRPWRPALPEVIPPGALDEAGADADRRLPLGLLDRPEDQSQPVLRLDLDEGGTWLAVGGPRSGRTTALRTVLAEAVRRYDADELHVHVIEGGSGVLGPEAALLPHTGTVVTSEDALRTVRLVDRLAEEVAARRAGSVPGRRPRLLLLVDGLETVTAVLDDSDPGRGSGHLLRVLRDGAAAGLTCVATTDRAVPGGRIAAVARHRLVLPLPDRADYAVAGVAVRSVPAHRPPGRALVGEEGHECQLALPRPLTGARGGPVRQGRPLTIPELPAQPCLPLPQPVAGGPGLLLPVGPGGDEGRPLTVDLSRTGGLLVAGPPGSGRTAALSAFAQHLHALGAAVLVLGPAGRHLPGLPDVPHVDPRDGDALARWLHEVGDRPGVVVADDIGAPADAPAVARLAAGMGRPEVVLLAAGDPGQLSAHYQGPVAALRRSRTGLLLCPGPGDADLLGVRLPRTPVPRRPGSGWLVAGAALERVQVARRVTVPGTGSATPAQSSSSAEPISWLAYQASS